MRANLGAFPLASLTELVRVCDSVPTFATVHTPAPARAPRDPVRVAHLTAAGPHHKTGLPTPLDTGHTAISLSSPSRAGSLSREPSRGSEPVVSPRP